MALRRDEQYEGFDWQREAACRGEHAAAFFPPTHFERKEMRLARERVAKAICRTCPVSAECLQYAITSREPHGVWGGLNEVERREFIERRVADDLSPAGHTGRTMQGGQGGQGGHDDGDDSSRSSSPR